MSTALIDALLVAIGILGGVLLRAFIFGKSYGSDETTLKQHDTMLSKLEDSMDTIHTTVTKLGMIIENLKDIDYLPRKEFNVVHASLVDQVATNRREVQRHLDWHAGHKTDNSPWPPIERKR